MRLGRPRFLNRILKYKHILLSLVFLIQIVWFFYCEKTVVPKHIMYSPLDDYIPFVKEFVIAYVLWYVYMPAGFIYLAIVSKKDYYKLLIYMFTGMTISQILYIIYPSMQNLRPVITGTDIFSRAVHYIYSIDTPTNVTPSVHVVNSMAVYISLAGSPKISKKRWIKVLLFVFTFLIIASTMFIKQHSIVDVFWGIALSCILYIFIFPLVEFIKRRKH